MQAKRNTFKPEFKSKVDLDVLKGEKTWAQLAQVHGVHPDQISAWKKHLLEDAATTLFHCERTSKVDEVDIDELYEKIGKLEMERDVLATRPGISGRATRDER